MDNNNANTAILERLERIVESLLDKQDRIDAVLFEKIESLHKDMGRATDEIKKGCERDIRLVDNRLRVMEKKMWSIFGALSLISVLVSPIGQRILRNGLTQSIESSSMEIVRPLMSELS